MKETIRWHLSIPLTDNPRALGEIKRDDKGEYVLYLDHKEEAEQLQARIKELESQSHINEIKAQGIEEFDKYFIEPELNSAGISMNDYNIYDILHESIQAIIKKLRTKHD